jgi:hypothetical protein
MSVSHRNLYYHAELAALAGFRAAAACRRMLACTAGLPASLECHLLLRTLVATSHASRAVLSRPPRCCTTTPQVHVSRHFYRVNEKNTRRKGKGEPAPLQVRAGDRRAPQHSSCGGIQNVCPCGGIQNVCPCGGIQSVCPCGGIQNVCPCGSIQNVCPCEWHYRSVHCCPVQCSGWRRSAAHTRATGCHRLPCAVQSPRGPHRAVHAVLGGIWWCRYGSGRGWHPCWWPGVCRCLCPSLRSCSPTLTWPASGCS